MNDDERRSLAEEVRRKCLQAALRAWEEAGAAGLCAEGRWELVVEALRHLDAKDLAPRSPDLET
jgi:hypothetical protein